MLSMSKLLRLIHRPFKDQALLQSLAVLVLVVVVVVRSLVGRFLVVSQGSMRVTHLADHKCHCFSMQERTNNVKDLLLTSAGKGVTAQEQQACTEIHETLTNLVSDVRYLKAAHWSWEGSGDHKRIN